MGFLLHHFHLMQIVVINIFKVIILISTPTKLPYDFCSMASKATTWNAACEAAKTAVDGN